MSVSLGLGRWRQEDQKLKIVLSYISSGIHETPSKSKGWSNGSVNNVVVQV